MTLKQTKQRGFTIVELLIVVVIIAILAAITIVAYNGIQNRAKTSSTQAVASSIQKKFEAFAVDPNGTGLYPTTLSQITSATSDKTYYFPASGVTLVTAAVISAAPADNKSINFYPCNSGKGYQIKYWDFTLTSGNLQTISGGDQASCTTLATS